MSKNIKKSPHGGTKSKRFQTHFRKAYNGRFTGHPQYVYDEEGNKYKVLGVTSAPETNGIKNVLLERNPEPNNSKPAYIRTKPAREEKGAFSERLKGWKFSEHDKKKVQKIIDKYDRKK